MLSLGKSDFQYVSSSHWRELESNLHSTILQTEINPGKLASGAVCPIAKDILQPNQIIVNVNRCRKTCLFLGPGWRRLKMVDSKSNRLAAHYQLERANTHYYTYVYCQMENIHSTLDSYCSNARLPSWELLLSHRLRHCNGSVCIMSSSTTTTYSMDW